MRTYTLMEYHRYRKIRKTPRSYLAGQLEVEPTRRCHHKESIEKTLLSVTIKKSEDTPKRFSQILYYMYTFYSDICLPGLPFQSPRLFMYNTGTNPETST